MWMPGERLYNNFFTLQLKEYMARDPAILYYDGDAARDMGHMNRTERGAYIDLVHAQKKFGRMPLDVIKKVLGRDFETCWGAVELIMTQTEGKYFIEWLDASLEKRASFSESRRQNRRKKDTSSTSDKDMLKTSETLVKHMEIEIENEIVDEEEKKGEGTEEGDNPYLIPAMLQTWKKHIPKYPEEREKDFLALHGLSEFICKQANVPYNPRDGDCMSTILTAWEKWAVFVSKDDFYSSFSLASVKTNSQTIFQKMNNGTKRKTNQQDQQPRGAVISGQKDYGKL